MSIESVLENFAVDFDVIRQAPLDRVKGRVVEVGSGSLFRARGSIQPATPKDLQRLPEGQRTDGSIVIYTDCELLTGDAPGTRADHVIPCGSAYNGIEFEIQSLEIWPRHRKYIAIKVGQ